MSATQARPQEAPPPSGTWREGRRGAAGRQGTWAHQQQLCFQHIEAPMRIGGSANAMGDGWISRAAARRRQPSQV